MDDAAPVDVLVVGNYCHDTLIAKDGTEHRVLGGSAAYISAVLQALGASFKTVAKVGSDFRYRHQLIQPAVTEGNRSCSFIDDYRTGERVETVDSIGPRIYPDDIQGSYRVAIACGIAGEVLPQTLRALRSHASLVLADAQGLARTIGPRGEVRVQPLEESAFASCLHVIDGLKIGSAEKPCVNPRSLRAMLLYTEGERGCTLELPPNTFGKRTRMHAAPFPAVERDATGAGDCFLAGFAFGLLRGLAPVRAARWGNYCGAKAVESVGVPQLSPGDLLPLLAG